MKFVVALGYGENVQSIDEFDTIDTVEAETAEEAAEMIFNGLEPGEEVNAIFQVRAEDDNEYEYFEYFFL